MANTVRIKRSTSTDTPTTLANAEIAYSESSDKFFIGVGTGGAGGSATTIMAIGGKGAFADLASAQTVAGIKTFSSSPVVPTVTSSDDSTKAASTAYVKAQGYLTTTTAGTTYAPLASPTFTGTPLSTTASVGTNTTQIATTAFVIGQGNSTAGTIAMNGTQAAGTSNLYARADHIHPTDTTLAPLASPTFTGVPAAPTAAADTNTTQIATTAYVVGQSYLKSATASTTYAPIASPTFTGTVTIPSGASISGFAPLASPTLTGTPAAPTATAGTNTTQIATTAFVSTAVSNLVASAPDALNTLNELALALGSDASFSTTVATSLGGKLTTASNLSELTATASTARTNLGLGTISTQAASNVSITGGTIDGVTIDGGTF